MITSITAFSQDKKVLHNQFSDYVQFKKDHQKPEFNRHHRPEFGHQHFPMQPRPLSVTVKGDKVILIFNKEDYNKLRPIVINRDRVMYREKPHGKFRKMFDEKFDN